MLAAELVADINKVVSPTSASSSPRDFVDVAGITFFTAESEAMVASFGERMVRLRDRVGKGPDDW